jgi:hypothetical protein
MLWSHVTVFRNILVANAFISRHKYAYSTNFTGLRFFRIPSFRITNYRMMCYWITWFRTDILSNW